MKTPTGARARLQRAALDLFREQGYDQTTAAEIAERAGVTERTFFRYFPDKREVLFGGENELHDALGAALADAPEDLGPLDALLWALQSVRPMIEAYRPFTEPRHSVISATPALRERELTKRAALAGAVADGLAGRGVSGPHGDLAAQIGVAAFLHAVVSWFEAPERGLGEHLDLAFRDLQGLLTGTPSSPRN